MSKDINNREYRQKVLRDLISQLHDGRSVDEVKSQFAEAFEGVTAEEISQAEQALIANGLPVSEVQRLCDVHAAVFKGSIEEIHTPSDPSQIPGHPAHTLKQENRALEELINQIRSNQNAAQLKPLLEKLWEIDKHYLRKENLLFPYLEQYGITAPPKVMWGVDDEIRNQLKTAKAGDSEGLDGLLNKIAEMIFKEENILMPMLLENLTQEEWKKIADESGELGYCLIGEVPDWNPSGEAAAEVEREKSIPGVLNLPTGVLKVSELTALLDTLPIDVTFVDKDDTVKYFSQGKERIFPRTKAAIGRKVINCHPPASVHIVEKIIEDFKNGKKDHEDFWIHMGQRLVYIRYFAVRNEQGEYLGVLEVTQDIQPIQAITGEKRLVSD